MITTSGFVPALSFRARASATLTAASLSFVLLGVLTPQKGQAASGIKSRHVAVRRADSKKTTTYLRVEVGGHTSTVRSALFTPDTDELITVSNDKSLRVWDVRSGIQKQVVRFEIGPGQQGSLRAAALQPKGNLVAVAVRGSQSGDADDTDAILLWNRRNGKVQRIATDLRLQPSLVFSPDGTKIAATGIKGGRFSQLRIWDVATLKLDRAFPRGLEAAWVPDDAVGSPAELTRMTCLSFSPDGSQIATGNRYGTLRIFQTATGDVVAEKDFAAGRPIEALDWANDPVSGGPALVVGVEDYLYVWNQKKDYFDKQPAGNHVTCAAWAPDGSGRVIAGVGSNKTDITYPIVLWERTRTGREPQSIGIHNISVSTVALSPDGTTAASADAAGRVCLWNTKALPDANGSSVPQPRAVMESRAVPLRRVRWTTDSKTVLWATSEGGAPALANADNPRSLVDAANALATYRDTTAAGVNDPTWNGAFDFSAATLLEDIPAPDQVAWYPHHVGFVSQLRHNTGAAYLHMNNGPDSSSVDVMDFDHRLLLRIPLAEGDAALCGTLISPTRAVIGTGRGLFLWDLAAPNGPKKLRPFIGFEGLPLDVATSPDGRYVATAAQDGTLRVFPVAPVFEPLRRAKDGRVVRNERAGTGSVSSASMASIAVANESLPVAPLVSLFPTQDREWIVWNDKTGLYTASARGDDMVGWQINAGPDQLASFRRAYDMQKLKLHPEVMMAALKSGTIDEAVEKVKPAEGIAKANAAPVGEALTKLPTVEYVRMKGADLLVEATQKAGTRVFRANQSSVTLELNAFDETGQIDAGAVRWEARINRDARERELAPRGGKGIDIDAGYELKVNDLKPGDNQIDVYAITAAGTSQPATFHVLYDPPKEVVKKKTRTHPNLYVLSIGIRQFEKAPQFALSYADRDATDLVETLRSQEGKLFDKVIPVSLINAAATGDNIRQAIGQMRTRLQAEDFLQNPDDLVVIFISTHGELKKGVNPPQFCIVPANYDPKKPDTLLPFSVLTQDLAGLPASNVVLMLDQCNSGAALSDVERLVQNDEHRKMRRYLSFVTLTASTADQKSWEDPAWRHGAFTFALLRALNGQLPGQRAIADSDGNLIRLRVCIPLIQSEVARIVKERKAGEKQSPVPLWPPDRSGGGDITLAVFPGKEKELVP